MMVWLLFIIDLMGLFFYNKVGSIISIGDLPTTNIIEPVLSATSKMCFEQPTDSFLVCSLTFIEYQYEWKMGSYHFAMIEA